MTTSLTSILQTPQAFPLQQILGQKSAYMYKLIDYISVSPDPLLMNERQCYCYPGKSVQILNMIGVYKLLIKKEQKKVIDGTKHKSDSQQQDTQYDYPYLDRLFKNLKTIQNQQILLGYIDKVLFSLAKKTPQIYEYFKDNQQSLMTILKNDKILVSMKEFLNLFLTESTMMLYVFLKNMVLRTLMFRIVEDEQTGPIVYQMICDFYQELLKAYLTINNEEDKEQIVEVLRNFEEENFIALLALKISPEHHRRTYFIAKILNQVAGSPNTVSHLVAPYIDTYTEYLEAYEESEDFMLLIMPDQLMMLRLILRICAIEKDALNDIKEESIKRLLVYSNVHQRNAIIHNMLFSLIQILQEQDNRKVLLKAKIIQFLKNNLKPTSPFNFKGLVKRICMFFNEKKLDVQLDNQEEKVFITKYWCERKQKLASSHYFNQAKNQSQLLYANLSVVNEKEEKKNETDTEADQKST